MKGPASTRRRPRARTITDGAGSDPAPGRRDVAIALGANVGRPDEAISRAVDGLRAFVTSLRLSPLYVTEPVGGPPQPDFLNAVVTGWTELSPLDLLARMKGLERSAGRLRAGGERNGPRPLDLDLLLYGDERLDLPGLVVPHPRLAARRFVLVPLSDLVPGRLVPGLGNTVSELLATAPPSRVERWPGGPAAPSGAVGD